MNESIDSRVDRGAFSVVSLDEADSELDYWLSRTPRERLEGIEKTRQVFYGYTSTSVRFQRVFEIADLHQVELSIWNSNLNLRTTCLRTLSLRDDKSSSRTSSP